MSTAHTVYRPTPRRRDPDLRASASFAVLSAEDGGDLPAGCEGAWLQLMDGGSQAATSAPSCNAQPRQLLHG